MTDYVVHLFVVLYPETPGNPWDSSSVPGSSSNHSALLLILSLCFDLHFPHIANGREEYSVIEIDKLVIIRLHNENQWNFIQNSGISYQKNPYVILF